MKHIFLERDNIKKYLAERQVYIFLDFDGTLAPIADTPDRACIPSKTKEVLAVLSHAAGTKLAVVSGRSLSDIKSVVGLGGIVYVGNHGLEIEGAPQVPAWSADQDYIRILEEIRAKAIGACGAVQGVFIENKQLSLGFHYRMVGNGEEKVRGIFLAIIEPYKLSGMISIMHGKKFIEVRPAVKCDKGVIVQQILDYERARASGADTMAIYIGDDETDEKAFRVLGDRDISIVVGDAPRSAAKYFVNTTEQVYEFLAMIAEMRGQ